MNARPEVPTERRAPEGRGATESSPVAWQATLPVELLVAVLIASIFLFDVQTTADHVSVGFLYTLPLLLCFFSRPHLVIVGATITTALTLVGVFTHTPEDYVTTIFLANRIIAILMQWIAAILVTTQQRATAVAERRLAEQRDTIDRQARFIDVLSHEIGTPLTMVDGHAFQLARKSTQPELSEIRQRSDKIRDGVRHIKELIERVQLASEVERDTVARVTEPVDLAEIVLSTIADFRDQGADIRHEGEFLSRKLRGDSFMVTQIVQNLISNAVKYSDKGNPVTVRWREKDGVAILSVSDTGRGIPPEELKRVFSPYFRGSNSRGVRGIGIGLFVTEHFVKSLKGTIQLDSRIGLGTTVTIRLPIENETTDDDNPVH